MPNARLRSPAGKQSSLFDLMRGPHGTLLAIDTSSDLRNAPSVKGDLHMFSIGVRSRTNCDFVLETGDLSELSGRTVAIRPDGYIWGISP
jgi:hypothetical protein